MGGQHDDTGGAPPSLSIVTLVWRHADHIDRCLRSVARAMGPRAYEHIVVVNGQTPAIDAVLAEHDVVVVRPAVNRGFAGGCNVGAAVAQAPVLVFLNDDAEVEDGWATAALAALETPEVAAVASLVLDEAGTVVLDGAGRFDGGEPLGRWHGAEPAEVASGPAEWLSGCSLFVDRAAFAAVGGFDERYHPAYFEDVDLSLSLRCMGATLWLAADSRVRHAGGASTSPTRRAAIYEQGRRQFHRRWPDPARQVAAATTTAGSGARDNSSVDAPTVIVVDDACPVPSMGSGMPRMHQHVHALVDAGFDVFVHPVDPTLPLADDLRDRGVRVLLDPFGPDRPDAVDAIVVSRPHNLRVSDPIAATYPAARHVYDAEARFAARLEKQRPFAADDDDADRLQEEWDATRRLEEDIARSLDAIVCISDEEAGWFSRAGGHSVHTVSAFPAAATPIGGSFGDRSGALCLAGWRGGADTPNGDGLRWFVDDVLPLVLDEVPWFDLSVTGADAPAEMRDLAPAHVHFVGEVDDLDALLAQRRVSVIPLRYGAGVKIKLVDSLRAGLPVVSTPVGAEGLPPRWAPACRVAAHPESFAAHLVELLTSPPAWQQARSAIEALAGVGDGLDDSRRGATASTWRQVLTA